MQLQLYRRLFDQTSVSLFSFYAFDDMAEVGVCTTDSTGTREGDPIIEHTPDF
jgi:hypothetical protein